MSNLSEEIKPLKLELQKIQEQIQEKIGQEYKKVLLKHPEILALGWDQYTDYFNDGEQCNFHVHGLNVKFNPALITNESEDGWFGEGFYNLEDGYPELEIVEEGTDLESLEKDLCELEEVHGSSDFETFFLGAFGDHVRIVIDRDSISITDRTDHD